MSQLRKMFLRNSAAYSEAYQAAGLGPAPIKRGALLTCMDARILLSRSFGLNEGDIHIIRNAGGRATDDAIRSLVISHKFLGTQEFHVMHHTDCGLNTVDDETITDLLGQSLNPATRTEEGWTDPGGDDGSPEAAYIKWMTFKDQTKSLRQDVWRIRQHPLVPGRIPVFGYIFDAHTGKVHEDAEASRIGAAV